MRLNIELKLFLTKVLKVQLVSSRLLIVNGRRQNILKTELLSKRKLKGLANSQPIRIAKVRTLRVWLTV